MKIFLKTCIVAIMLVICSTSLVLARSQNVYNAHRTDFPEWSVQGFVGNDAFTRFCVYKRVDGAAKIALIDILETRAGSEGKLGYHLFLIDERMNLSNKLFGRIVMATFSFRGLADDSAGIEVAEMIIQGTDNVGFLNLSDTLIFKLTHSTGVTIMVENLGKYDIDSAGINANSGSFENCVIETKAFDIDKLNNLD